LKLRQPSLCSSLQAALLWCLAVVAVVPVNTAVVGRTFPLLDPLAGNGLTAAPAVSANVTPAKAAERLRACVGRYRESMPPFNVTSSWAGRVIEVEGNGLVVGPLVPKVASTDMRIALGIKVWQERLDDFRTLSETLTKRSGRAPLQNKLWFALVRNPLAKLVSGYEQVSKSHIFLVDFKKHHPKCAAALDYADAWPRQKQLQTEFVGRFCSMSVECQEMHFQKLFGDGVTIFEAEHRAAQMNWLIDAVDRLDALVR
jgi:hypothetical protein